MSGLSLALVAAQARSGRIHGLDLARGIAVIGMVVVNLALGAGVYDAGLMGALAGAFSGRAAAVFVVLAGVGLSIGAGGRRLSWSEAGPRRATLARRAGSLAVLGFGWMAVWTPDILHFYAVWLLIGAAALSTSDRGLWAAVVGVLLVATAMQLGLDYDEGWDWATMARSGLLTPRGFLRDLLFNGFHPVFPWVAFLLFGMRLGRVDLRDAAVRRRWAAGLIAVWLLVEGLSRGAVHLAIAEGLDPDLAHALLAVSPMPPTFIYILGAGAMAGAAILLSIDLAEAWPRATATLRAMGRQALTLYVAHAVLLVLPAALWVEAGGGISPGLALGFTVTWVLAAAGFVRLWSAHRSRGPVEALMRWATTRR
jgi:uncharacterized membrane protein YeiB